MDKRELRIRLGQRVAVGFDGDRIPPEFRNLVREWKAGNVILFRRNVRSFSQLKELCGELTRLMEGETGIAPLITIDEESGSVSRLAHIASPTPGAMAIGATGRPENAEKVGRMIGQELRALGINMNLAPVLDCNTNPRNPVIGVRSFGGDPVQVAAFGTAYMRGLQSAGVLACGKHFPGHGDTAVDSHIGLPVVDKPIERLRTEELVSFRAAIQAGIDAIMSAHVIFPALEKERMPATVSQRVMTGLLRQEMGFDGLIVSDGMEMEGVSRLFGIEEATRRALEAGVDMALICHSPHQAASTLAHLERAALEGRLDLAKNDRSVARLLHAKKKAGHGPERDATPFADNEQAEACRRIMREAVRVLHAPDGQALPPLDGMLCFGSVACQESFANDRVTLNAAQVCAAELHGTFVADPLDEGAALLEAAHMGKTMLLALTAGDPRLSELIALGKRLAEAGARLIAVAMTTPYCMDELPDSAWKIAVYQYDALGVDALLAYLRRA